MSQCDTCQWLENTLKHNLEKWDEARRCAEQIAQGEDDVYSRHTANMRHTYRAQYLAASQMKERHDRYFHPPV